MPAATYAGHSVDVNDEGFLTDPGQWTEDMALQIAKSAGVEELTARHWRVIRFMRAEYQAKGTGLERNGTDRPRARQDLRRHHQGALPALPQGPGQDRRQDRRDPQATRLHLTHREDGRLSWTQPSRRFRS